MTPAEIRTRLAELVIEERAEFAKQDLRARELGVPNAGWNATEWVRRERGELMRAIAPVGVCPGCHKPYESPDHDPRCSSCAESGTGPEPPNRTARQAAWLEERAWALADAIRDLCEAGGSIERVVSELIQYGAVRALTSPQSAKLQQ